MVTCGLRSHTSGAQRRHELAVKIVLAAIGCAQLSAGQQAIQQPRALANESLGGEFIKLAGYNEDDELARTLDRTNDDEFNLSPAGASQLVAARASDKAAWLPLVEPTRRSDQSGQTEMSPRELLDVHTDNQTSILLAGRANSSGSASQQAEQLGATYLLINRLSGAHDDQVQRESSAGQSGAAGSGGAELASASQPTGPNSTIDSLPPADR